MKKITAKLLSGLPDGLFAVDRNLFIRTRGEKQTYVFCYQFKNRRHTVSLGDAQLVSSTAARSRAIEYRALIEQGIDPIKEKHKDDENTPGEILFRDFTKIALEKIAETKQWRNPKSATQWRNTIKTYVLPTLGKKPLDSIDRDDIVKVLSPIWKTKPETASRLRGRIEAIFNLAIVMKLYSKANPATWRGNLSFFLAPTAKVKTVEHHEALTFDELREFFAERFYEDLVTVSSLAIMFGVLTATRVNEFIGMTWSEIDFKKRVWTIPPSRRKDGKKQAHRVPLSEQAMQILERLDQSTYFVFQSPKGVGHLSKETPRVILRKRFGRGTMHGCRSTFSDWCTETGKDPTLREKSLMHATGNEVTLAYQRSDLLEQRRPLMQAWADALTK